MIRSLLAAVIGGLATFVFLLIWDATRFTDPIVAYALAGVIGAIGTLLWPLVIAAWFAARRRSRRNDRIQDEVQRQLAQKG